VLQSSGSILLIVGQIPYAGRNFLFKGIKKLLAQSRKDAKKNHSSENKLCALATLREKLFKTKSAAPSKLKAAQSVFL
jgi:hypothetical protein